MSSPHPDSDSRGPASSTNDIPIRQNSEESLTLLRAQRARYRAAKRLAVLQAVATVGIPIVLSLAAARLPDLAPLAGLTGLLILALDVSLLQALREGARLQAARSQELLDCSLFRLPWNPVVAGTQLRPHEAAEWARKLPESEAEGLRDWYAPRVGDLPIEAARVLCQKINTQWDRRLRHRFATLLAAAFGGAVVVLLVYGTLNDVSLRAFVAHLGTLSPTLYWIGREAKEHRRVAGEIRSLGARVDDLWHSVLKGGGDADLKAMSRSVQDQVFARRRDGSEVADWLYRITRPADQQDMEGLVSDHIREFQSARGTP